MFRNTYPGYKQSATRAGRRDLGLVDTVDDLHISTFALRKREKEQSSGQWLHWIYPMLGQAGRIFLGVTTLCSGSEMCNVH